MNATIYHTPYGADDEQTAEIARDIRMGLDWFQNDAGHGPLAHVFDEVYAEAGEVDADDPVAAYEAWEQGEGHDPTETRSMSVGDIIVVDGVAHFVESVGFEEVDVPTGEN